jgi:hypothetical protein
LHIELASVLNLEVCLAEDQKVSSRKSIKNG